MDCCKAKSLMMNQNIQKKLRLNCNCHTNPSSYFKDKKFDILVNTFICFLAER